MYVIVFVPAFASEGSNVPLIGSVIPVPLQVPPAVAAVKLNTVALAHIGDTAVILALAPEVTVIETVSIAPQVPEIEYVIICVPIPAIAGSNVPDTPDVIPVPVHVPPVVAASKLKVAAPLHIVAG